MEGFRIATKKPAHKEEAFEEMERMNRARQFERMNRSKTSQTRALALDLDKDHILKSLCALPQPASSSSNATGSQQLLAPVQAAASITPVHHVAAGVIAVPGTTGSSSSNSSPPGTSSSGGSRMGGSDIGWGDHDFADPVVTLGDMSSIMQIQNLFSSGPGGTGPIYSSLAFLN